MTAGRVALIVLLVVLTSTGFAGLYSAVNDDGWGGVFGTALYLGAGVAILVTVAVWVAVQNRRQR